MALVHMRAVVVQGDIALRLWGKTLVVVILQRQQYPFRRELMRWSLVVVALLASEQRMALEEYPHRLTLTQLSEVVAETIIPPLLIRMALEVLAVVVVVTETLLVMLELLVRGLLAETERPMRITLAVVAVVLVRLE